MSKVSKSKQILDYIDSCFDAWNSVKEGTFSKVLVALAVSMGVMSFLIFFPVFVGYAFTYAMALLNPVLKKIPFLDVKDAVYPNQDFIVGGLMSSMISFVLLMVYLGRDKDGVDQTVTQNLEDYSS